LQVGRGAKNFISTINRMYEMENASKTLPKKEVKTVPKTEPAGKGEPDTANSAKAIAFNKAKKSGDWTEYLKITGTLQKITPE
jgi:hypothetical protein